MKYSVETVLASGGRLGMLTQMSNGKAVTIETPMCTLFTKGGSVPHLSASMLQKISKIPSVACMNLAQLATHHENIKEFGKGLKEFTAIENKIIFTTLHDASIDLTAVSGKNDKLGVAVWNKGGKFKLDPELFIKVQEAFHPDWIQALSDGDTDKTCARKRLGKAVDRTLDFLDRVIEKKKESEILKNSSLIGVIEGGYSIEERIRSAKETSTRLVDAFMIEGFEKGYTKTKLFDDEDFVKVLSETITHLPDDKPRMMETPWSPVDVIKAFRLGVDIFSSAYPHLLTEKGYALVADYSLPPKHQSAKLECGDSIRNNASQGLWVDLNDKRFFDSFTPVMSDCECYTCVNFTCSYIHHLRNTSELLSYVLLTIHNFEQYFKFFQHLQEAIRNNRLAELEDSLQQQQQVGQDVIR